MNWCLGCQTVDKLLNYILLCGINVRFAFVIYYDFSRAYMPSNPDSELFFLNIFAMYLRCCLIMLFTHLLLKCLANGNTFLLVFQDLINNDAVTLDDMFKLSLVGDVINVILQRYSLSNYLYY